MARGTRCLAHKHTAIVAEENHHLQPQSRGGLTVKANLRYLCANAHGDTHYLLDLIEKQATPLIGTGVDINDPIDAIPWLTMRTYGPGVRNAAITGWLQYGQAFLRGDYRKHAALWSTSGAPRSDAERRLGRWPLIGVGISILRLPYAMAAQAPDLDKILRSI
jgi:hypothetical protein